MFCFHSSLPTREDDTQLPKNFLFDSEKNLNKLSYKNSCLGLSDSNIPKSNVHSKLTAWDRWRNARVKVDLIENKEDLSREQLHSDTRNKIIDNNSCHRYNTVTKTIAPENKNMENNKVSEEHSFDPFQAREMEFIDESEPGLTDFKHITDENEDCMHDKKIADSIVHAEITQGRFEPFKGQSNRKKSIKNTKAISNNNNNTILPGDGGFKFVGSDNINGVFLKTESTKKLNELPDTQVIVRVNSNLESSCHFHSNHVNEILKETDNKNNKKFKEQKINSGTLFLSFCSLFNLSKSSSGTTEEVCSKNNDNKPMNEPDDPCSLPQDINTNPVTCCPLPSQLVPPRDTRKTKNRDSPEKVVIISKSPKSKNKAFLSNFKSGTKSADFSNSSLYSCNSSSGGTSSGVVAPIASPEVISPTGSSLSSKFSDYSNSDLSQEQYVMPALKDFSSELNFQSNVSLANTNSQVKFKLLHEGDIQVCYLNHSRTILSKVLSSKFLRRWETHHIYLKEDYICSKTPSGFLESPVSYSAIDDLYVVGRWDQANRFCIRVVMAEGSLLLQTTNSIARDRWLSSILWKKNMHKYKNILTISTRPEVIVKEIKGLIYTSLNSQLQDDCITNVPIEIISKVLNEDDIWNDRQISEEVIIASAPLLEDSTPTPEMFKFFSRHCLQHPRSPVVIDIFTSIVNRILKRTMDFGKSPLMRRFVADYLKALHMQNDGDEAIRRFVKSIHGPSCGCPHPRVLPNMVAVNLAAVFSHFEQRKKLLTECGNESHCPQAVQLLDKQLHCYITLFLAISEFEDWRPGLAQLLQPIPFPDDALSNDVFIKGFTPVIRSIVTDPRCDVHEMVLGIRENKEGWLNIFCPSSLVCKDDGILWCEMLQCLFSCCCRRKTFLQKMTKHLGALLLVALRDHAVAQEILCLMLEWRLINGEDQEMQVVTTLKSTENGRLKYSELCKLQAHLKELQKKGGPKKLTLPSRSTDADVAKLLSCGSFGNLECLSLAFTHVTSACAYHLIQLPALRYLNLWATQFGDAGLIVIAEHLDKLQVLNLCETPVSDKGIAAITEMKSLKKLNLNSTKLSPQTLETLKHKLPSLQELDVRYTDAW